MKTLEYWVDSLNPEFLEPAMAEVLPALMAALKAQLRPLPHPFGVKALTVLGKLGGRNRRYIKVRVPCCQINERAQLREARMKRWSFCAVRNAH
jgi:transformation/transcription domain-associated protein